MRSKLLGLLLSGLFILVFLGCKTEVGDFQDKPVSVTYKGVITDVPVSESSLYDATHFLDLGSEKVYLRSLIYDLNDRLYDGALISVSGVPRLVRAQKTLTVDRILILNASDDSGKEESIDDDSDAGQDIDEEDLLVNQEESEALSVKNEESFQGRSDDYVLPVDFSELTSLPLGFKVAYPKNFYYAQVQNGYAFAEDEVVEDDIASWKIYIQLKNNNFVALPEAWQNLSFKLDGREVIIYYLDIERTVIEQMLSSFAFL